MSRDDYMEYNNDKDNYTIFSVKDFDNCHKYEDIDGKYFYLNSANQAKKVSLEDKSQYATMDLNKPIFNKYHINTLDNNTIKYLFDVTYPKDPTDTSLSFINYSNRVRNYNYN